MMAALYMYQYTVAIVIQPFMVELGISIEYFGLLYMSFTSLGIFGGLIAGRVERRLGSKKIITISVVVSVSTMAIPAFLPGPFALSGIVLQRFSYALAETILAVQLNRELQAGNRSSMFSFVSLLRCSMLMVSRPFLGMMVNEFGGSIGFTIWFLLGIPIAIALLLMFSRLHEESLEKKEFVPS
jgi:MFS family permease